MVAATNPQAYTETSQRLTEQVYALVLGDIREIILFMLAAGLLNIAAMRLGYRDIPHWITENPQQKTRIRTIAKHLEMITFTVMLVLSAYMAAVVY
jgi:hypothetical protein